MDDPDFWRDHAYRSEATGDMAGAVNFWQMAILTTERRAKRAGVKPDLNWLHRRLALAKSVADLPQGAPPHDHVH